MNFIEDKSVLRQLELFDMKKGRLDIFIPKIFSEQNIQLVTIS